MEGQHPPKRESWEGRGDRMEKIMETDILIDIGNSQGKKGIFRVELCWAKCHGCWLMCVDMQG